MRISVCVGNYATTPYRVPGPELSAYCAEELCYCLKENAFLVDVTLMNDNLLRWLDKECGLSDLARELHPLVHKQGSLSAFVSMIMQYVGLYDAETIRQIEQVLKKGAGLSNIEKRKSQVDYLVQKKKYVAALRGYDDLLTLWGQLQKSERELPAADVQADIVHNKGVAYAGLMLYDTAASCFLEANRLAPGEKHLECYLAAKRMELSESEYISFAASLPEAYEQTLRLEKKIEQMKSDWQEHADYMRLMQRKEWREGNDKQKYYDENERLTQALKDSYRISVSE